MGLLSRIKEWFARVFARDPEEARRKAELRRVYSILAEIHPPFYRPKQNIVLPGFANAILRFYYLVRPLAELARATIASADIKTSQRFFDYLIDCRLSDPDQERKRFFAYEGMSERVGAALKPDDEIESILREFQAFLRALEGLGSRAVNDDLYEVDRFIDLCRHDYERILGLFDPAASIDDPRYKPDFSPVAGEQALPEIVDFYYLTEGFVFSPPLKANVLRLVARRQAAAVDGDRKGKIDKLFSQLDAITSERLDKDILLCMIRSIRGEPFYTPPTPRERKDYLESYKRRLMLQFDKDRERMTRERHESAIAADIKSLFGDAEIAEIEGYDDENDSMIRRESPNGFALIKPLRLLKTFVSVVFDPMLKESVKRVLVEGYFDNKAYQNNLANVLYQCERAGARISEFEEQLRGNGRVSLASMRRYLEEMRRGKDIASFLTHFVDTVNDRARSIVEDEASLFAMLGEAIGELLADYRRSSPDLITNLHTFGGGRNREIMGQIQAGRDRIAILVKILRNFTFTKTPIQNAIAASAAAVGPFPRDALQGAPAGLRPGEPAEAKSAQP
jgi:hypothetical protein